MTIAIDALQRILQLEQRRGCADSTVIGGLDKYLRRWATEAGGSLNQPRLLRRFRELGLSQPSYATWDIPQRQEWVKKVLDWLAEIGADQTQPQEAPAKKTPGLAGKAISRAKATSVPFKLSLDSPITTVKGVSTVVAGRFRRLGVSTLHDMLYFFPRRHLDYSQRKSISQLEWGAEQTIVANIWEARQTLLGRRRGSEAIVGDNSGNIRVVWFNQPYIAQKLKTGDQIVLSGKVSLFRGQRVFESPEWELLEDKELIHTGRLVPVYPLTNGLYPRQVRKIVKTVLDTWSGQIEDFLPAPVKERRQLLDLSQAIYQAHYPDSELLKNKARERLAFDELILIQLGVLAKKLQWQESQSAALLKTDLELIAKALAFLPFKLTTAQQRVLGEIESDMEKDRPMSRLLQGEVGSGKTVVATLALLIAVANGCQGALMAPTEILAEQHFGTITRLLSGAGTVEESQDYLRRFSSLLPQAITIALLIGATERKEKLELQRLISEGKIDIVIGTHALIQKGVEFHRLGLAVVDEQHRFGVMQRLALRQKGFNPHVLVMTATPIPRTLALTLYGDLDLSVIDQLPPGRQVIKTKWLAPEQRGKAYAFLRRQITAGRQAFIICPLIEESETIEARAAVAEYERLSKEVFPDLGLGLLHGRMSAVEKEDTMRRFHAGQLSILVSTPVVEVGIDVPNATVMLVEGADRFGLSQLHQFRGRVGRGQEQSYCLLLAESPSPEGKERLALIEQIQDGFRLAEEDLRLRGPGEFFGTRQSGMPDLRMARLSDVVLLEHAREEATRLFQVDPQLKAPEHCRLAQEVTRLWQSAVGEIS